MATVYDRPHDVPGTVLGVRDARGRLWGRVRDTLAFVHVCGPELLKLADVITQYGPVTDATEERVSRPT